MTLNVNLLSSCKCPKENEWILDPVVIADTYGPEVWVCHMEVFLV